jgi:hypothetical protein
MFTPRCRCFLAVSITLLFFVTALPLCAQRTAALDSTLYTTYTMTSDETSVSWIVCGSTAQSSGCYGSGSIGPFVKLGAIMEGNPSTKGNVVTRAIYAVDSGNSSVVLYVYRKTDTITSSFDTVSVTLARTVTLQLTGGSTAQTSMAANTGFLFIGTDQSPNAYEVKKSNLSLTQIGGFSPPLNVTAITADQYGYVTVTQGEPSAGATGFTVIGPDGFAVEDGGGAPFMLNTVTATLSSTLPKSNSQSVRHVEYRPLPVPSNE